MFMLSVGLFQKLTKIVRLQATLNWVDDTLWLPLPNSSAARKLHIIAILCLSHSLKVLCKNIKLNCFVLQIAGKDAVGECWLET